MGLNACSDNYPVSATATQFVGPGLGNVNNISQVAACYLQDLGSDSSSRYITVEYRDMSLGHYRLKDDGGKTTLEQQWLYSISLRNSSNQSNSIDSKGCFVHAYERVDHSLALFLISFDSKNDVTVRIDADEAKRKSFDEESAELKRFADGIQQAAAAHQGYVAPDATWKL
ncbi:hypothetical protein G3A43_07345 [Paraburkholderia aspalathi]|nr:hypothetical protein [Paraburkholderia aspalathi]MBK3780068.1 hypothetical protein [Paraburkholderia aspalathi]